MTEQVECIVIGAGVIGLACAKALATAGKEVLILESENTIASGISSRNSEVIHAGIYYPKNSKKAELCVRGKNLLYEYCNNYKLPHKKLGKLIVAVNDTEIPELEKIRQKAIANDVLDLEFVDGKTLSILEPSLKAVSGLFSPSTGIIDSHQFMLSLLANAENSGAVLVCNSEVIGGNLSAHGFELQIKDKNNTNNTYNICAKYLINAAGFGAHTILHNINDFPKKHIPNLYYCKGNYFSLNIASPFKRLIYPIPNNAGLGVHLTLDMHDRAKFGPDTQWIDNLDYDVDNTRLDYFYNTIKTYWPDIPKTALEPGYTGIRPKLAKEGEAPADFMIQGALVHGISGLVNLFGIESPGLTASLAIADEVLLQLE